MPGTLVPALFAVHLPDGMLTEPWWIGGFAVAAVMALFGAWRIRDEEIPRVALLTAAFFVTTLIHVPVPAGPKTHLLLNGLLGVVLGRRAGLAIPVGLFLQAALFQHGGFTTIGINSCVMGLPAFLAWGLFATLRRTPWVRQPWFRAALVAVSAELLLLGLVYSVTLLLTNPLRQLETLDYASANSLTFHPLTLAGTCILAALAAWAEHRFENSPEFALGLLVGEVAALATIFLNCFALLYGGREDYHIMGLLTLVIHLPLAIVEGIILGFTVGFLVRVKPEMIGWDASASAASVLPAAPSTNGNLPESVPSKTNAMTTSSVAASPPALLVGLLLVLLTSNPAWAHRLDADSRVQIVQKVRIESYFSDDSRPRGARIQVFRVGAAEPFLEDRLNEQGEYEFLADLEPLRVVISAGEGHGKELLITPTVTDKSTPLPPIEHQTGVPVKEALLGIGLLVAVAAFALSLRNARQLRELKKGASSPRIF